MNLKDESERFFFLKRFFETPCTCTCEVLLPSEEGWSTTGVVTTDR